MSETRIGVLMALAAVLGWSANTLFSRMLAGVVPPFTLSLLRTTVALVIFTPFALPSLRKAWPFIRARIRFYVFLAVTGLGVFNGLVYVAGRTTTAINMSILNTATPVFILLLARIKYGEALTPKRMFGVLAAIFGVLLLTTKGDIAVLRALSFQPGDLVMLCAAILFACYSVGVRYKDPEVDNNGLLLAMIAISFVYLLPLSAVELFVLDIPARITPASITGVLYLGIVASILCYIWWTGAISRIGPSATSLFYYLLPLFTGTEAVLILNEAVLWVHFVGGGLIIAGVIVATRK
ncbi:DMT family transporter [Desulfovibrio sp. OttesenSCG-928-O18]|nr:DMT family transporter [Desulfovibrio sp. OttesenSCG-928-O18]